MRGFIWSTKAHRKGIEQDLTIIPYVHAMFSTGNDEDNRAVFLAEDANQLNLVGLALRGPKKQLIRQLKDFLCINKIFIEE